MVASIDKKVLKRLDKLYFGIDRICKNENLSTRLVNLIHSQGFIEFLCTCIKNCDYECAVIITEGAHGVQYYTQMIYENMPYIIMGSIFSPIAMRFALKLYDKYGMPSTFKPTADVIICIKRHAIVYPANKEICNKFLSKCDLENIIGLTHIFFIQDDVELVSKYFSKKNKIMDHIIGGASECSSKEILKKALHYVKEHDAFLGKMSLPFVIKYVDLNDRQNWEAMLVEVCQYAKWDYLPYLFELYSEDEDFWKAIRSCFYKAYITVPFLQVLIQQMKYHNIPIEKILLKTTDRFYGEKEVLEELRKNKIDEIIELHEVTVAKKHIKFTYSNLFEAFRKNDITLVLDLMFSNMAHVNPKFLEEKSYIDKLNEANIFGFTDKVKLSFELFTKFVNHILRQLNYYEMIILDFNSVVALKDKIPDTLVLRCINRINKVVDKITVKFLTEKYLTLLQDLKKYHFIYLNNFRNSLCLDRNDWTKPEKYDLEEEFIDILQHSYARTDYNMEHKTSKLIDVANQKGNYKLASLISFAMKNYCHYDDIIQIIKN